MQGFSSSLAYQGRSNHLSVKSNNAEQVLRSLIGQLLKCIFSPKFKLKINLACREREEAGQLVDAPSEQSK